MVERELLDSFLDQHSRDRFLCDFNPWLNFAFNSALIGEANATRVLAISLSVQSFDQHLSKDKFMNAFHQMAMLRLLPSQEATCLST